MHPNDTIHFPCTHIEHRVTGPLDDDGTLHFSCAVCDRTWSERNLPLMQAASRRRIEALAQRQKRLSDVSRELLLLAIATMVFSLMLQVIVIAR